MCNELMLLSEFDDYRCIAICEHDTIHLSWDHTTVYLRPEELLSLDLCLDQAIVAGPEGIFKQNMQVDTRQDAACLLWVFDVALRLSADNFLILTELVSQAAQKMPASIARRRNPDIHLKGWLPFQTVRFGKNHTSY